MDSVLEEGPRSRYTQFAQPPPCFCDAHSLPPSNSIGSKWAFMLWLRSVQELPPGRTIHPVSLVPSRRTFAVRHLSLLAVVRWRRLLIMPCFRLVLRHHRIPRGLDDADVL